MRPNNGAVPTYGYLPMWTYVTQSENPGDIFRARKRPLIFLIAVFVLAVLCLQFFLEAERWESFLRTFGGYFLDDASLEAAKEELMNDEEIASEKKQGEALPRTTSRDYRNFTLDASVKYFLYSPSGGFNNQRIELEYALIIAKMLKRTLIVPPMGKHSSFFGRYELLTPAQMVPMDKIFDFEQLAKFNPVLAMGNQRILTYVKNLGRAGYDIKTIFHPDRLGWHEKDVTVSLSPISTKYHPWGFNLKDTQAMYTTVRFTKGIRDVALGVIDRNFPEREFNAIHVRVGDYSDRTPPMDKFSRQMAQRGFKEDVPLYIATEPNTPRSMFASLCARYKCKFSKDLEGENLQRFAEAVPQGQIRQDMLGVVEQLVCVGAKHFVGTTFSTFSLKISQMRKFRSFAFPEFAESEEEKSKESDGDDMSLDDETEKDSDGK